MKSRVGPVPPSILLLLAFGGSAEAATGCSSPYVATDASDLSAAIACANNNSDIQINIQGTSGNPGTIDVTGTPPPAITSTGTTTFSGGIITDDGSANAMGQTVLQQAGSGTTVLGTTTTYSGATLVSQGTLQAAGTNVFSPASDFTVSSNGSVQGTLDLNGFSQTIGSLSGGGAVTLETNAGTVLTVGANGKSTGFDGIISGAGGLTLDPSNGYTATTFNQNINFNLTGQNTYTGPTTIDVGFLSLQNGATVGGPILVNNSADHQFGGTLGFSGSNGASVLVGNDISGPGGVEINGEQVTFTGNLSGYTGRIGIDESSSDPGALIVGRNAFGNASLFVVIDASGTFDLNGHAVQLSALGDGTSFGNDPTNVGTVLLNGGTLTLGNNGGQNLFDYYAGPIADGAMAGGSLVKVDPSTLELAAANTYTGGTTIQAGTVQIGDSAALGTGTVTLAGGTFQALAGGSRRVTTPVAGGQGRDPLHPNGAALFLTGAITDGTNPGTLTFANTAGNSETVLSGTNTGFTGATVIASGASVQLAAAGALPAGALEVQSNAALDLAGFDGSVTVLTGAGTIENSGVNAGTSQSANSLTVQSGNFSGLLADATTGNTSGTLSLVKVSNGTLTLSGSGVYDGGTFLDAGRLELASGDAIGSSRLTAANGTTVGFAAPVIELGNPITLIPGGNNAAFDTEGNTAILSGTISGGGGLTKAGAGELLLLADNTYTGGTTISAGVLQLGGGPADTGSIVGDVVDNGTLVFVRTNPGAFDGTISGTGFVTNYDGTLTPTAANTYAGGTFIVGGSNPNSAVGDGGVVQVTNSTLSGGTVVSSSVGTGSVNFVGGTLQAAAPLTIGNALAVVAFGGTIDNAGNALTLTGPITGGRTNGTLTFANSAGNGVATVLAGANTFAGGAIVTGNVALATANGLGSGALTVTGTIDLGGFDQAVTTLDGSGLVTNTGSYDGAPGTTSANTLAANSGNFSGTLVDGQASTAAGTFAGTVALTKASDGTASGGTLVLSGTNLYSGPTQVNAGTLQAGSTAGFSRFSAFSLAPGAIVDVGGFTSEIGALSGSGTVTNSGAAATLTAGRLNNSTTFAGALTDGAGPLAFTKVGTGTLTLTGANTLTGGTTVAAGTLQVGNGGTTGSLAGNVTNNAALAFDRSDAVTFGGGITGTGSLAQLGTGTLILTGAETYTGGTTVAAGTLQVGNGGTTGSLAGDVATTGTLAFDRSNIIIYGGAITGAGSLAQLGTGTLILTGTNTYTGGTTVAAGTLQVGNGGTTGSIAGNIATTGTLAFDRSDAFTFGGTVTGAGSVAQLGTGTLTLTGANTYAGGTTVTAGTIAIDNAGALGTGALSLADGTTLAFGNSFAIANPIRFTGAADPTIDTGANTDTVSGPITGPGALTKLGSGTLILTGTNTYTGGTAVAAGTLVGSATGFGTGTIADSAALVIDQGTDAALANTISGPGSLTKTGAGALDLTGVSTLTGPTTVAAGTLLVDGSLAGSVVTVGSGAVLGGAGRVGGFVAGNGATVAPGVARPLSTLGVAGDVAFGPGSVYRVAVDPAGGTDAIVAGGAARITGGTVDVLAGTGAYSTASAFDILSAARGVTGAFTGLTTTTNLAFLTPVLRYGADDVTLGFAANGVSFADVAATPNERAVAVAAQGLGPTSGVFGALETLSAAQARTALDALSGAGHASTVTAAIQDAQRVGGLLFDRLWTIGGGGLDARTLLQQLAPKDGPALPINCFAPLPSTTPPPTTYTLWGEGFGDFGHDGGDRNGAGIDRSLGGFVVGLDAPIHGFTAPYRVGVAGGYTNDQLGSTGAGGSQGPGTFESIFGAVYGGARYGAIDVRLAASVADNSTSMTRAVVLPTLAESERSVYGGNTEQVQGEVGYRFSGTRWVAEPVADLGYVHVHQDDYRERGGAAALAGAAEDNDVGTSTLGARGEVAPVAGIPLVARAFLGWRHAFGDVSPTTTLAFETGSTPFTVAGAPIDRDALAAEAGLDWRYSEAVTLGASYVGQIGARDQDNGVKGRFEVRF